MNTSRTHYSRKIQYSAGNLTFDGRESLKRQIVSRINRRNKPQSLKMLQKWFYGTNPVFVQECVNALLSEEKLVTDIGGYDLNPAYPWNDRSFEA